MPKLMLQFEGRVLKECGVGDVVTIGRLPDNAIVIENPAVSGHHARIVRDGDDVFVEDLESTNGTYVNDRPVVRQKLRDGDVVLVGKHHIVFDAIASAAPTTSEPALPGLGDTLYLDTQKHRALLTSLRQARADADRAAGRPATVRVAGAANGRPAVLRVLEGRAAQPEFRLDAQTSLVGRSENALVRLHGWFAPRVALAIARGAHGYVATSVAGRTLLNGRPFSGRRDLSDGDVLRVGGLTLEFRLDAGAAGAPAAAAMERPMFQVR